MAKNWLEAHADFSAGVHTFGQCMALADLNADGDHRLIIADHGQFLINRAQAKLKVYRGTSLVAENAILDLPVAIAAFHMDTTQPRIPAIAVASGPHIYIYKNMRPYFKFSLPPMDVSSVERDVWAQAKEGNIEVDILTDMLSGLSKEVGFSRLTARSQHLLSLPEAAMRRKFIEEQKGQPLKRQTTITCLTTLKKALPDEDAVTCLVVGTESGHVYILDSEAFTILDTVQVSGVPCFMGAVGLRDVEFRIVVACRNRQLLQIKRGWREARPLAQPPAQTLGLAIGPNAVVVALMDDTLRWYSKKGKEAWCVSLPSVVRCLTAAPLPQHGLWAAAVGLVDGSVLLYTDGRLIDSIPTPRPVSALICGTFGQGEHCIVVNSEDGGLMVHILRRTATFDSGTGDAESKGSQPLSIPKKTKLFVEQTVREREASKAIHDAFQTDLLRLRLKVARSCESALTGSSTGNPISNSQPLRLAAQVRGLGPTFQLTVEVENMAEKEAMIGLAIVFHFDNKIYQVDQPFIKVPLLVPRFPFEVETLVKYVSATPGLTGVVRVLVVKGTQQQAPLLAALIHMPIPGDLDSV